MDSNMVKPAKFADHHLVYHFTVPLKGWIANVILVEDKTYLFIKIFKF